MSIDDGISPVKSVSTDTCTFYVANDSGVDTFGGNVIFMGNPGESVNIGIDPVAAGTTREINYIWPYITPYNRLAGVVNGPIGYWEFKRNPADFPKARVRLVS